MADHTVDEVRIPDIEWPSDAEKASLDLSFDVFDLGVHVASTAQVLPVHPYAVHGQPIAEQQVLESAPDSSMSSIYVSSHIASTLSVASLAVSGLSDSRAGSSLDMSVEEQIQQHASSASDSDTCINSDAYTGYSANREQDSHRMEQQYEDLTAGLYGTQHRTFDRLPRLPEPRRQHFLPGRTARTNRDLQAIRATIYRDRHGRIVRVKESDSVPVRAKKMVKKAWGVMKHYYVLRPEETTVSRRDRSRRQ
ncbi:unnamed protein product [Discula destructiva]